MRPLYQVALVILCIIGIEMAVYTVYKDFALGELAAPIQEHTTALMEGAIPAADEIDFETDSWVRVAHFESTFYQTLFVIDMITMLLIAWVMLRGRISAAIARWAEKLSPNIHLSRGLYLIAYTSLFTIISIPTQISGYLIEGLRGTSFFSFDFFIAGLLQDTMIGAVFALLTFVPFYWIIDRFKKSWWIVGAAFMSAFSAFTMFVSPVILDPLYLDLDPLPDAPLAERIETLANIAGVPIEDVYISDTDNTTFESNAFVTGVGASKRIVLDDTLLTFYTDDEIVSIVGHEIGHYALHHIWYDILVLTASTFVSFYLLFLALGYAVQRFGASFGARRINDITLYPLIGALLGLIGLFTAPATSYVSRTFEAQADAYELHLAANPQASASSLKKMAYQSFTDPDPSPLMQWWFGSHPSMKERVDFFENSTR